MIFRFSVLKRPPILIQNHDGSRQSDLLTYLYRTDYWILFHIRSIILVLIWVHTCPQCGPQEPYRLLLCPVSGCLILVACFFHTRRSWCSITLSLLNLSSPSHCLLPEPGLLGHGNICPPFSNTVDISHLSCHQFLCLEYSGSC